ncbi:MAG: hypothetical protein J0H68_03720 [Sphingobacteriia bacterium]|nr:hypothetical protein [Sphingobacteriia bacterium]
MNCDLANDHSINNQKIYDILTKEAKFAYNQHLKISQAIKWIKEFETTNNIKSVDDFNTYIETLTPKEKKELQCHFNEFSKTARFVPSKFLASLITSIRNDELNQKFDLKEKFFLLENNYNTLKEESDYSNAEGLEDYIITHIKSGEPFKISVLLRYKINSQVHYCANNLEYNGKTLSVLTFDSIMGKQYALLSERLNSYLNTKNLDYIQVKYKDGLKEIKVHANESIQDIDDIWSLVYEKYLWYYAKQILEKNNLNTEIKTYTFPLDTQNDIYSCYSFAISLLKNGAKTLNQKTVDDLIKEANSGEIVKNNLIYYKHLQSVSLLEKLNNKLSNPEFKPGLNASNILENKTIIVDYGHNPISDKQLVKKINFSILEASLNNLEKALKCLRNESKEEVLNRIQNILSIDNEFNFTDYETAIYEYQISKEEYYCSKEKIKVVSENVSEYQINNYLMDGYNIKVIDLNEDYLF